MTQIHRSTEATSGPSTRRSPPPSEPGFCPEISSKALAERLGVSRTSVVRAYHELAREGWVVARVGSGTVVRTRSRTGPVHTIDWDLLSTARTPPQEAEFAELLRSLGRADLVSFAGGLPPADFYPVEAARRAMSETLETAAADLFHWCPVEEFPPLRDWLALRPGGADPSPKRCSEPRRPV